MDTVKFEEKRTMSASKTKVIKDGFSSEQVKNTFKKINIISCMRKPTIKLYIRTLESSDLFGTYFAYFLSKLTYILYN